jgi:hypothetical protein
MSMETAKHVHSSMAAIFLSHAEHAPHHAHCPTLSQQPGTQTQGKGENSAPRSKQACTETPLPQTGTRSSMQGRSHSQCNTQNKTVSSLRTGKPTNTLPIQHPPKPAQFLPAHHRATLPLSHRATRCFLTGLGSPPSSSVSLLDSPVFSISAEESDSGCRELLCLRFLDCCLIRADRRTSPDDDGCRCLALGLGLALGLALGLPLALAFGFFLPVVALRRERDLSLSGGSSTLARPVGALLRRRTRTL